MLNFWYPTKFQSYILVYIQNIYFKMNLLIEINMYFLLVLEGRWERISPMNLAEFYWHITSSNKIPWHLASQKKDDIDNNFNLPLEFNKKNIFPRNVLRCFIHWRYIRYKFHKNEKSDRFCSFMFPITVCPVSYSSDLEDLLLT